MAPAAITVAAWSNSSDKRGLPTLQACIACVYSTAGWRRVGVTDSGEIRFELEK
jgi:hypothetical protein